MVTFALAQRMASMGMQGWLKPLTGAWVAEQQQHGQKGPTVGEPVPQRSHYDKLTVKNSKILCKCIRTMCWTLETCKALERNLKGVQDVSAKTEEDG